jgi:uncharacterized Fe-S cluster protein YjdI
MFDNEDGEMIKKYTNGEITIVWKRSACIHATHCFVELPEVFDPAERPWINANGASTEKIIAQIKRCPTDALSFYYNDPEKNNSDMENNKEEKNTVNIEILPNGPALVKATKISVDHKGEKSEKEEMVALCRCGASKTKPYCDGTHYSTKFEE